MIIAKSFSEYFYFAVFAAAIAVPVVLVAYAVSRARSGELKFSLRTLTIVGTVIAITLGLCVYVIRKQMNPTTYLTSAQFRAFCARRRK
jgi:Na+-driven multidrug efflux pump